jgi:hypothetical protein
MADYTNDINATTDTSAVFQDHGDMDIDDGRSLSHKDVLALKKAVREINVLVGNRRIALAESGGSNMNLYYTTSGLQARNQADSGYVDVYGQSFVGSGATASFIGGRLRLTTGTALVAGDFALSSGFGSTASVGTISGNDTHARFTVTSAGTGQGANPTVTLTFSDGAMASAPFAIVSRNGGDQADVLPTWTTTTTTLVITFPGTPVAAETYTFEFIAAA